MKTLGENIKALRKGHGWTQVELAQKVGVTQVSVTAYETNRKRPTLDKIRRIAKLFSVDINELLGDEELSISEEKKVPHKNRRIIQMQKHFESLGPDDQKSVLKYTKTLAQSQQNH